MPRGREPGVRAPRRARIALLAGFLSLFTVAVCVGTAVGGERVVHGSLATKRLSAVRGKIVLLAQTNGVDELRVVAVTPRAGGLVQTIARFPGLPSSTGSSTFGLYGNGGDSGLTLPIGPGGSSGQVEPSIVLRQLFNTDFTRLAYSWKSSDGSERIGYLTTTGAVVNLTPGRRGGGYVSTAPLEYGPLFRPNSSLLIFRKMRNPGDTQASPVDVYQVDTNRGISSRRRITDARVGGDRRSAYPIAFSADGRYMTTVPYGQFAGPRGDWQGPSNPSLTPEHAYIYGPRDTLAAAMSSAGVLISSPRQAWKSENFVSNGLPGAFSCEINGWVSSTAMLCGNSSNVYLLALRGGSKSKLSPLLPAVKDRGDWDPIASPDGKRFAFLSQSFVTNTVSIFVAPTSGHGAISKVADFPAQCGYCYRLVEWSR